MASRTLVTMKSNLPRQIARTFPSLGNLFSPLQYAVRRFSGVLGDKERAEERIYIETHQGEALREIRLQFEREVRAIYKGLVLENENILSWRRKVAFVLIPNLMSPILNKITESGEKLDVATLEKLVAWKLRDKITHM